MYKHTRNYENLNRRLFEGIGDYNIPEIKPEYVDKDYEFNFIPFNLAIRTKEKENHSVHFYIDDYQFIRIWDNIDSYVNMFKKFRYVLSPDFSTYTDFPVAIQIYNHYRKHWIGAYLQEQGIKVIPTISWSTPDSFNWCFDGEPKYSTVSVSSVGCMANKKYTKGFMIGFEEMLKRLRPSTILFFGKISDDCRWLLSDYECDIIRFKSYMENLYGGK